MYYHRELEEKIAPFLKRREVLAILGPRQSGKTTFLEHLQSVSQRAGKKVKFITFEKKSDLDLFSNSIDDFKSLIETYDSVIIDEFQYAKDGGKALKYLYDTTKVKFIVSGSSSLELTFQTGKYMVGRMFDFTLAPFSFREFLSAKDNELHRVLERKKFGDLMIFDPRKSFGPEVNRRFTAFLEEYALFGGYPAVVLSKTVEEKKKTLENITEKYILRDIKDLLRLATDDELWRLEKFLAGQIGNMVRYEELSLSSGLSYTNVKKHLNILEKTYILSLVRPYFTNPRTELVKNPKIYFEDLGLRNASINDFRPLIERNDTGAVMENYAFQLLKKLYGEHIKYWRTKSKAEVDFVVEQEGQVYPIEVKYSSKRAIGKSVYSFIEKFKPPIAVVLTKDYAGEEKAGKTIIKFIPLSYF
ncbi:MAG TPA: ATP-binding protein [Patescibacteria group bacterium]|nr:ATP-binding protein [Patescibacteria group bacterium]